MMKHLTVALLTCLLVLTPMPTYADELLEIQHSISEAKESSQDNAVRIADLEAQLNLLKAQQALLLNSITQQTDAIKAQKDLVDAKTALLNDQITQAKALIPTVSSQTGTAGAISGEPSAARGSVKAWIELDEAFTKVANSVHERFGDSCTLIVNPPALDDFIYSKWVTESLRLVAKQLPTRVDALKKATPEELLRPPSKETPERTFAATLIPGLISPLLDSVLGITKLFRTDKAFSGIAISPSNDSIYNVAASRLLAVKCRVIDVEHLPVPDDKFQEEFAVSELNKAVETITEKLAEADNIYALVASNAKKIEADPKSDKTLFPFYDSAVARWKDLTESLHKALDPIITVPATATDSIALKLFKGVMVEQLLLKGSARLMYLKVEALGGNRVISKNAWRSDHEYESASYIVTYRILERTGEVVLAGKLASVGKFEQLSLP